MSTQTPNWLDYVCAAGGFEDASLLFEWANGRRLVLPMVRGVGRWPGGRCRPPIRRPGASAAASARAHRTRRPSADVFRYLSSQPALRTLIRPNPRAAETWAAACPSRTMTIPARAHVLDLAGGFDRVWSKQFAGSARTAIRKAERSGLVVERDTTGRLMSVFYDLFKRSVDRWAGQQHEPRLLAHWRARRRDPLQKLQMMVQSLGEACHVWVAWSDGRPAAGIVVLQGANAHYTRGAMDKAWPGRPERTISCIGWRSRRPARPVVSSITWVRAARAARSRSSRAGSARLPSLRRVSTGAAPLTPIEHRLRGLVKRAIGSGTFPSPASSRPRDR